MRIIDIIQEYKDIYDIEGDIAQLYQERQQIFFALAREQLRLFPDVMPLLLKIKNRGLKIAMATSGDRAYTELVFKKFTQLTSFFSVVVTSEDVIRGKPYPDVYLKTAQELHVSPRMCIVLEDSVNGILAAKTAGMQVICIPNRYFLQADYSQADRIFATLGEVSSEIM
jgi:HAD superfamily hydrolase (TIGR01509 family)